MRISRIHVEQPLAPDQRLVMDAQAGHYLYRVLKLRAGDPLVVFNGDGSDYAAELLSNRRDRVELRITARLPAVPEPSLRIELAQAVGKGDRMDFCLQKATELGVSAIQPLFSERTEVRLAGDRLERRSEHWRRVISSACEQSGRATIPRLLPATDLDSWLADSGRSSCLVLEPTSEKALSAQALDGDEVTLAVGPEGGFAKRELKQFRLAGAQPVSLGPRILRTESAGPAAIAVLQALHGDF